jgi:hypothetical protein
MMVCHHGLGAFLGRGRVLGRPNYMTRAMPTSSYSSRALVLHTIALLVLQPSCTEGSRGGLVAELADSTKRQAKYFPVELLTEALERVCRYEIWRATQAVGDRGIGASS